LHKYIFKDELRRGRGVREGAGKMNEERRLSVRRENGWCLP